VNLGISNISVRPGDHICALYGGVRQRDAIMLPFLEAGLRAGNKCICVVDSTEPTEVVGALDPAVEACACTKSAQLDVIRASDMYLRSGRFSAAETIGSWKAAVSEVMYDGRFEMVRAVETWSQSETVPPSELLVLESEMNRFLPLFPQVILCLYDINAFGGGMVVDLLKTHPRILLGGMILENPHYLSPDELLALR
jgi:hypothetical protein